MPALPVPALAPARGEVDLLDPVFISDLHLTALRPRTLERFLQLLADWPRAGGAELVILGDLFEYWAGDDDLAAEAGKIGDAGETVGDAVAQALRSMAARGVPVYVMHGNRDLLLGPGFLAAAGATLLADPALGRVAGVPALLAHGDAYCTRDLDYQRFRAQARNPQFQAGFLARPLAERKAMIGEARSASEAGKQAKAMEIMDVTPEAIDAALRAAGTARMIHGHTHRPAHHVFDLDGAPAQRWVLTDWDLDGGVERGGGLRLEGGSLKAFRV